MSFRTYSTKEAAELIGINRRLFPLMNELEILKGIRCSSGRRYSEKEIEEFWEEWKGYDLSNAECIRFSKALKRTKKGI